jgi:cytochrome c oxidase subunit 2
MENTVVEPGFWHKLLGLPVLASKHGQHVDNLIIWMHWLMGALFVGWMAYFLYVLFRFRQSKNPKADYIGARTHASTYIEGLVALAEGVLLVGVAIPFWSKLVDDFPDRNSPDTLVVRVVAQQFNWNFLYPGKDRAFAKQDMKLVSDANPFGIDKTDEASKDDFQIAQELHIPVNKPVILDISSKDVIHSFKVISFRITQDAIPGMRIPTHFIATKPGRYQINCAQLCGTGHYSMSGGYVVVETQENYDKWLAGQAGKAGAPTSFE